MADIFGREAEDYAVVRDMQEQKIWERHEQGMADIRPQARPLHDFQALGSGVPTEWQRATQDQQAVGYLTNNMLAIQTMADEIMYTAYRLPRFVFINTSIAEGAETYGVRVRDRVGKANRISAPGFDAPSATVSESLATQNIHWYGLDAQWSVDELRSAMFSGVPLDTEAIEAAVTGTMETMEAVGLTGGGYSERGLLNLPITGTNSVTHTTQGNNMTFADLTSVQIRDLINGRMSNVIEISRETLGRNINNGHDRVSAWTSVRSADHEVHWRQCTAYPHGFDHGG